LTDWLSITPSRRAGLATRHVARLPQQVKSDGLKQTVVAPVVETALHRGERRKILWQHSPLTASPRDIQDRIKHATQPGLARAAQPLNRRHVRLNQRPFGIAQIACPTLPSRSYFRRVISLHILCLDDCCTTTIMPEPTEITQFIFGQPLR
jgi:hypothetical protein